MIGANSPDGRRVWFGLRNQPALMALDTTTMTPAIGDDLSSSTGIAFHESGSVGTVRSVVPSPDQRYRYASLTEGAHVYECSDQ